MPLTQSKMETKNSGAIVWRVRIAAPIERVWDALATDRGRASFWAESAIETEGVIRFRFPDASEYASRVLRAERPHVFSIEYFQSVATFTLSGSTDVMLVNEGVPEHEHAEVTAGWVSVLMQLKAAMQFGVDLRNHSREINWQAGYVEN